MQIAAKQRGGISISTGFRPSLNLTNGQPGNGSLHNQTFRRRESVNVDKYAVWSISPDVRTTYSEDGAVLLDIRKGLCYSLDPVAARIWDTMESSQSGVDLLCLVDVMQTHYKVPRERLERDIAEYLSKLERMGLVQCNGLFQESKAAGARG